ncbi:MAG: SDR family oxidoreductase [Anaerolineaceae bacterium]|nr:SDR family oxidoreductase [Anaerolineaceae bacterium]
MQKTLLITGAARRIGAFLAKELAKQNYNIVLHYGSSVREAKLVAQDIRDDGGTCHMIQADLSDIKSCEKIFDDLDQMGIGIQYLIHNASIFENTKFEEMKPDQWVNAMQVNLTTPVMMNQAFAKRINNNQKGRILHLLDWRALRPGVDHFPYTISKAALASVTKSLAIALAPRIQVNGIAFGAILPPADGGDTSSLLMDIPMNRWAKMEEVLKTVLFLLEGPDYITGEIIHLDGGRHLV